MDLLIKSGANVNALDQNMMSPLHFAAIAEKGDHSNYNIRNIFNFYSLLSADEDRISDLLIKSDADVNVQNVDGFTPLHLASTKGSSHAVYNEIKCIQRNQMYFLGHNRVVEQLIKSGANVNLTDKKYRQTALHLASIKGLFRFIFFSLEKKTIESFIHWQTFGGLFAFI